MLRHLKGLLRESWDALASWELERETSLRFPWTLWCSTPMCVTAKLLGLQPLIQSRPQAALEWFTFAALLLAGFYGMLRPGDSGSEGVADSGALRYSKRGAVLHGGH